MWACLCVYACVCARVTTRGVCVWLSDISFVNHKVLYKCFQKAVDSPRLWVNEITFVDVGVSLVFYRGICSSLVAALQNVQK